MHRSALILLVALSAAIAVPPATAQVAGSTTIGISVADVQVVALGWSARKQILGTVVYNENAEQVGKIEDLIVAPDSAVSFVIIGAGGFVGLKRHHVAIPAMQLTAQKGSFVLTGATKAAIKAMPEFDYGQ
jgi:sporulation protein YlmC with PRC-barrel domain